MTDSSSEALTPTHNLDGRSLSGREVTLRAGNTEATVTEVGAALRTLRVAQRDVIVPFALDQVPSSFHGAVLLPWPNRLAGGRYQWDGTEYQLPITEPGRNTALHGLTLWHRWQLHQPDEASVVASIETVPLPGYPFPLHVAISYQLESGGLTISATTTNRGTVDAPYGIGFHPWLHPGLGSLDDAVLRLDADGWVSTDADLLPTGETGLPPQADFREPRTLNSSILDDAFTQPRWGQDGRSWVRLSGTDGLTASVWMEQGLSYWQVCTGDELADPADRRTGLAVEPMTCYADAFNSGTGLIRLRPQASHTVRWGLRLERSNEAVPHTTDR